jgi:hypothetical protein
MYLIASQHISLFGADGLGESDLVLGLDWFTSYHDKYALEGTFRGQKYTLSAKGDGT